MSCGIDCLLDQQQMRERLYLKHSLYDTFQLESP